MSDRADFDLGKIDVACQSDRIDNIRTLSCFVIDLSRKNGRLALYPPVCWHHQDNTGKMDIQIDLKPFRADLALVEEDLGRGKIAADLDFLQMTGMNVFRLFGEAGIDGHPFIFIDNFLGFCPGVRARIVPAGAGFFRNRRESPMERIKAASKSSRTSISASPSWNRHK